MYLVCINIVCFGIPLNSFFNVEPSFHYKSIIKIERVDNDRKKESPVCFSLIDSTLGNTS